MHLTLITNTDTHRHELYKIARIVYAETGAASLRVCEALCAMIYNASQKNKCPPYDIACDTSMFESLNPKSVRHKDLSVSANDRGFQMCLRLVGYMLRGKLADRCYGATSFHREDMMPEWATARGYIAEIDGLLFYL